MDNHERSGGCLGHEACCHQAAIVRTSERRLCRQIMRSRPLLLHRDCIGARRCRGEGLALEHSSQKEGPSSASLRARLSTQRWHKLASSSSSQTRTLHSCAMQSCTVRSRQHRRSACHSTHLAVQLRHEDVHLGLQLQILFLEPRILRLHRAQRQALPQT